MSAYQVRVSPAARRKLLTMPKASFEKVRKTIDLLQSTPYRGSVYDPTYEAARLPFICRVVYVKKWGIYYTVHDDEHLVYIRYLEDQRRDPRKRFGEN